MTRVFSRSSLGLRLGLPLIVLFALPLRTFAQQVDFGGRAYLDYFYTLSSPDPEAEDLHGFTYRRLYLTTDFILSDEFTGRARLEANQGSEGPSGPAPFVKDLWLAWRYSGDHDVRLGVMPPPVFELAESVWGYRSLEQTILDLQDINSSRDFGIRFNGPLGEDVRYAVMLANNNGVRPEVDPYKRFYAQLAFYPADHLVFSLGADRAGYAGPREGSTRISGFGGYRTERLNGGLELYWSQTTYDAIDSYRNVGSSLYARYLVTPVWEAVGRLDLVAEGFGDIDQNETFVLLGAAYMPTSGVRLIPNIWWFEREAVDDSEILARMTVEVRF